MQEDPPAGVSGAPTEDNILAWEAIIFGPQVWKINGMCHVGKECVVTRNRWVVQVFLFLCDRAIRGITVIRRCSSQDTPFEDGTFKLSLEFTEEYPNKPPVVRTMKKLQ